MQTAAEVVVLVVVVEAVEVAASAPDAATPRKSETFMVKRMCRCRGMVIEVMTKVTRYSASST